MRRRVEPRLHPYRSRLYRALNARRSAIHLFLLSPPLSGSTLLQQLIATSPRVATFVHEGQGLPEAAPFLAVENRWDPELVVDWPAVRDAFHAYWSPFKPIRFEKSPPHLVRAGQLERFFADSHFLVTLRNPYAQIEGALRRGWTPSARQGAEFWLTTARAQLANLAGLQRTLFFTYEELAEDAASVTRRILDFLPALESLSPEREFHAHNVTGAPIRGIRNLNREKIARLAPEQIRDVNAVLGGHEDLLSRLGYALIVP